MKRQSDSPRRPRQTLAFLAVLVTFVALVGPGCSDDETGVTFIGVTDAAPPRLGAATPEAGIAMDAGSD